MRNFRSILRTHFLGSGWAHKGRRVGEGHALQKNAVLLFLSFLFSLLLLLLLLLLHNITLRTHSSPVDRAPGPSACTNPRFRSG